jgi:MFS transporter, PPP family, 3-phenylpropionic acid transporter
MPSLARVTLLIMFIHGALGAIIPYLPVWFSETKGMSGAEIGLVLASSSFGRIVFGPLAAAWAEGRKDRRTPLIVFAACVAVGYAGFGLVGPFWPIALLCFATGIAVQCLVAFSEATTLRETAGSSIWPYGRARAMASLAFAGASLGAGALVQKFGIGAAYVWFLVATSLTLAWCFCLPRDFVAAHDKQPMRGRLKQGLALFKRPNFVIGVVAAGLIQAAHAFYYGFSSKLWLAQGFSGTQVGLLWATGVAVEVLFLAFVANRLDRVPPFLLMMIGGIGSAFRWISMSFGLGLTASFIVQGLHAFSFAVTHIGFMRLMEQELDQNERATGQQISSSLVMSPLMGIASICAGYLYDYFKGGGYWSGFLLAGAGSLLVVWWSKQAKGALDKQGSNAPQ